MVESRHEGGGDFRKGFCEGGLKIVMDLRGVLEGGGGGLGGTDIKKITYFGLK